jgi:hypothetical protein
MAGVSRRRKAHATRLIGSLVAAVAAVLATGSAAYAAAPANDNYLASAPVLTERYQDTVDTTEATEQPNIFEPAPDGRKAGAAEAEPLACDGRSYGKTVWYDFLPPTSGGLRITASGYDAVVAVYEYDPVSGRILRPVACRDATTGPTEELDVAPPGIKDGKYYTAQVGGAVVDGTARSGALNFNLEFYGDRDGDGVLDHNDACPKVAGARGGCPPQIGTTPRLTFAGLQLKVLDWAGLPRGTEVTATCRLCGRRGIRQKVRVREGGIARLRAFTGVKARHGAVLDVSAALAAHGSGEYRFGAIGKRARYRFGSRSENWAVRCLVPGSQEEMTCPR